jgi:hypothetical protein
MVGETLCNKLLDRINARHQKITKLMVRISALTYQTKFASAAHPVMAIDSVSLDVWLSSKISQPEILNLVPAQGWLYEDEDLEIARRRLSPHAEECSTIVPLLICPDDMDFWCTVVVAEQDATVDTVIWRRFGFTCDRPGAQVGASVKWFENNVSVHFDRSEFEEAVAELRRLLG